jgi:hypothetical protein
MLASVEQCYLFFFVLVILEVDGWAFGTVPWLSQY